MPQVTSIGLGGGSKIRTAEDGTITVGPDSVGFVGLAMYLRMIWLTSFSAAYH